MIEIITCDDGHDSIAYGIDYTKTPCPLCTVIAERDALEASLGDANDKNDELTTALGNANDEIDSLKGEE